MGLRQGIIGRRSSSKNLVLVGLHHSKAITRMDEAATLKAELKRFEKDFKAREGRAPGKADIKAHPEIALKYKLYNSKQKADTKGKGQVVEAQPEIGRSSSHSVSQPASASAASSINQAYVTPKKTRPAVVQITEEANIASPSRLRPAKAAFGSPKRSPAKKATSNPFAAPGDTPRTYARKWLGGLAPTPPRPDNWRRSSFNTSADNGHLEDVEMGTASTSTETTNANPTEVYFEPSPLKQAAKNGPAFQPVFGDDDEDDAISVTSLNKGALRQPSLPTSRVGTNAFSQNPRKLKNTLLSFNPVKASNVFDADKTGKKRPLEDTQPPRDVDAKQDSADAKKPAKQRKVASSTNEDTRGSKRKGKNKAKKIMEGDDDAGPARLPPRILDDGSLLVHAEGADGASQQLKVGAYKPYGRAMYSLVRPPDRQATGHSRNTMEEDIPAEAQEADEEEVWSDMDEIDRPHVREENEAAQDTSNSNTQTTADLPDHLLELLSIRASPTKKHRMQVAERKNLLVKRLLHEPSLLQAERAKSGLADLAESEDEHNSADMTDDSGDDDWQSENEGWKDVAAGDDLLGLDDV